MLTDSAFEKAVIMFRCVWDTELLDILQSEMCDGVMFGMKERNLHGLVQ